eukprot:gene11448-11594_t
MASQTIIAVFVVLAVAINAAQADSCARGCSSDLAAVQGQDGLFYINSCVARCQGTTLVSAPPARAAAGRLRIVSQKLMQQFAAENFRFINFARVRHATVNKQQQQQSSVSAPSLQQLPADRIIRYDAVNEAIYASAAPATLPVAEQQQIAAASRKLLSVQQQDERLAVSAQSSEPSLAAVGELLTYGQRYHCSAVLVGERTILTAASCVFDRHSGSFARGLYFVPGRFRDASGKIHAPHGAADVAEVFITSQFIVAGSEDSARSGDLAVGTLIKTACQAQQAGSALQLTECSIAEGQTGAPLVNAAGQVQGVVAASQADNAGVAVTPFLWETLIKPHLV